MMEIVNPFKDIYSEFHKQHHLRQYKDFVIKMHNRFKDIMKKEFNKVGITKYIFQYDINNIYASLRGMFRYNDKLYWFIYRVYTNGDFIIYAVEPYNKQFYLGKSMYYSYTKDGLFSTDKKKFRLPKHRLFNKDDYVLYRDPFTRNKFLVYKITNVNPGPRTKYTLQNIQKPHDIYFDISEGRLLLLEEGI